MRSTKIARPIQARAASSLAGLAQGWRREAAIRTHVTLSVAGLAGLTAAQAQASWLITGAVLMVAGLSCELINAAVEALLDRLHPERDDAIGAAKDMCSAAAFLLNLAAAGAVAAGVISSLDG